MEVLNAHSWAPLRISWLRICIFTRSPRWCGHTLIFENLTADHIFKDIYLQRKSELIQIKTVWISIHICDKPCSLSKNTWETFGYSILLIKLRHGDSSLQRQWVPLNHRLHYLNAVEGQFIPWPAALPQACPPRNWSVPPWAGLPLVPSSNSCCAGDISQLLSARKCKHMYLCASHIHITTSVQSLSCVRLFATPWIAAPQASLSITNSQSLPKLISIELVMPSSHLILCRPLFLLPPIPPSIRVFSNESTLCMRWPKYWSFSFNISPSNEHPGLIFFRMDFWLDLLAVQGTLKSLLQYHSSKASILGHSAFFTVQL